MLLRRVSGLSAAAGNFRSLRAVALCLVFLCPLTLSCTQESQNEISRSLQNWTGADGVLDIMNGGKVMYRFIEIDKLSTAKETGSGQASRPYRFSYGVLDKNMNYKADADEKKVYFEISDYSTEYVFYQNPMN